MHREKRAKAFVAAAVFALVVASVCLFWFALPSAQSGSVAYAQGAGGMAGPGGAGAPPGASPPPGIAPGGAPGGGGAMGGPSMGGGGGAPAGGGAMGGPSMGGGGGAPGGGGAMGGGGMMGAGGNPLEPSRANPFVPVDAPEPQAKFVTSRTRYGPDWKQVPMGYFTDLPQPAVPSAPPTAIPPNPRPAADMVRVTSIIWPAGEVGAGAPGRAMAVWENADGESRVAVPGSELVVSDPVTHETQRWRVVGIEQEAVSLRNSDTGEQVRVRPQARSRAESRYWGARQVSGALSEAQQAGRVEPGRGLQAPGGTAGAGGAGGMGGGGMGMGGPPGGGGGAMPGGGGAFGRY